MQDNGEGAGAGAQRGPVAPVAGVSGTAGDDAFEAALHEAVRILRAGGVIGLPTETVYGLAADAAQQAAVASIYRIKQRPADHPLIVHVAGIAQARQWADWTPQAQRLADAFWPGPLTLVLPRRAGAPDFACGGQPTIGVRAPSHPVFQALMRLLQAHGITGLAAPSANRFGRISPSRAAHVKSGLGDAVPLVLDGGPSQVGLESTIVDLSRGRAVILRPGRIGQAELQAALGEPVETGYQASPPVVAVRGQQAGEWGADGTGEGRAAPQAMAGAAGGKAASGGVAGCQTEGEAVAGYTVEADAPRVPGALVSHYAPSVPLCVLPQVALAGALRAAHEAGEPVALWSTQAPAPQPGLFWRRRPADAAAAGHDFYDALHQLDALPVRRILVEALPDGPAWQALADRLRRAAAG